MELVLVASACALGFLFGHGVQLAFDDGVVAFRPPAIVGDFFLEPIRWYGCALILEQASARNLFCLPGEWLAGGKACG